MIVYGLLWLVYAISLITSTLLGYEQEYVEFPLQQWLRKPATMLLYTNLSAFFSLSLSLSLSLSPKILRALHSTLCCNSHLYS